MPLLDNYPTTTQNSDVGIKISKPYYDAAKTRPENLIFSSSWPSLPIVFEVNIPDATALATYSIAPFTGSYMIPHGLKYPPLAFYWQVSDVSGKAGMGTVFLRTIADVDSTYIYIDPPISMEGLPGVTPPVNVKAFGINLSVDADYANPAGANNLPAAYDPNFGIKVSKVNKETTSKDLRDFILHSRAQSPLILAVKTQATSNVANTGSIQYTSKLPYPVWVYGFVRSITGSPAPLSNADYYRYAPYYSQAFPRTNTDGTTSSVTFNTFATGATLVILRDPMFAATLETVQY